MDTCDWNKPNSNPYSGTPRAAIMKMIEIPLPVRLQLSEQAEKRNSYSALLTITRGAITDGIAEYANPRTMAFGSRGKVCERFDRSRWDDAHTERGLAYCAERWCVVRPSVCNNWFIVDAPLGRLEPMRLSPVAGGLTVGTLEPVDLVSDLWTATVTDAPALPPLAPWGAPNGWQATYLPGFAFAPPMGVIPEPPTAWLVAIGAALLGFWRAMRRRRA